MKIKLLMALGCGIGSILHQVYSRGIVNIQWLQVLIVMLVGFVIFLLLPTRWFPRSGK